MSKTPKYDPQDFDELSRQIDDLLGTSGERIVTEDDGIDLAQYTPVDASVEAGAVYQNFSNGYGAARPTSGQGIPAVYRQILQRETGLALQQIPGSGFCPTQMIYVGGMICTGQGISSFERQ